MNCWSGFFWGDKLVFSHLPNDLLTIIIFRNDQESGGLHFKKMLWNYQESAVNSWRSDIPDFPAMEVREWLGYCSCREEFLWGLLEYISKNDSDYTFYKNFLYELSSSRDLRYVQPSKGDNCREGGVGRENVSKLSQPNAWWLVPIKCQGTAGVLHTQPWTAVMVAGCSRTIVVGCPFLHAVC